MVWAAFGHPGIIGPFFFDQNVNAVSRLKMISEQFPPEFCAFENSSELLFMQDCAPPHWAKALAKLQPAATLDRKRRC